MNVKDSAGFVVEVMLYVLGVSFRRGGEVEAVDRSNEKGHQATGQDRRGTPIKSITRPSCSKSLGVKKYIHEAKEVEKCARFLKQSTMFEVYNTLGAVTCKSRTRGTTR